MSSQTMRMLALTLWGSRVFSLLPRDLQALDHSLELVPFVLAVHLLLLRMPRSSGSSNITVVCPTSKEKANQRRDGGSHIITFGSNCLIFNNLFFCHKKNCQSFVSFHVPLSTTHMQQGQHCTRDQKSKYLVSFQRLPRLWR